MEYKIEELVSIVELLAEKYNAFENTSITYEKAEQFMEAVLYCINEAEQFEHYTNMLTTMMSAKQAYEIGMVYVEKKVKTALDLYNNMLSEFVDYQNRCLHDTFIKALPEFFRRYDIKFEPQNTILTLDYPILKDISEYKGIDKIYEYIKCIYLEQSFLSKFTESYVTNILYQYHHCYKDMIDNICEIVFRTIIAYILIHKPLSETIWEQTDNIKMKNIFLKNDLQYVNQYVINELKKFLKKYYENGEELFEYIEGSISGILKRFQIAMEHETFIKL
ncbi:DUF6179 domain-containing protein [Lachnospiraceae bacterium 46-61]